PNSLISVAAYLFRIGFVLCTCSLVLGNLCQDWKSTSKSTKKDVAENVVLSLTRVKIGDSLSNGLQLSRCTRTRGLPPRIGPSVVNHLTIRATLMETILTCCAMSKHRPKMTYNQATGLYG
uniref:Uncharacterized protein n=1 Tax=Ciona savignyi TaxID=51511 RepID=H2Y6Y8_CIOSA